LKRLNFEIEQTDIVDENPDSQFATAKIRAFSSGDSRNDTYCSEEALQFTAPTIYNKPLVYEVADMFGDFGSHTDPSKSLIAGFVVPGSAEFTRLPDNRLSLNVFVKIWKRYSPKAMEIFKRDGGKKKVSVEVDLLEGEERPDGLTEMKNFVYSAICVLGDLITEASPGAGLEMMSFSKAEEEYRADYKAEFSSKYENVDFTIPEAVKKNVSKGLSLYQEHNRGATSVSLASARFIEKNMTITPEKIKHISKFFKPDKFKNMIKTPPSDEYISYMLYGGSEGMVWAKEISGKIDELDSKQLSYFEDLTFPYKSLKDINPALGGIEPPISLAQANEIAKQADGIGSDKDKNGWAIAISSFKKTHEVKDGKWVKKEKINMEDLEKKKEEMAQEAPKEEMAEKPEEEKKEEMAADSPEAEKKEEDKEEKEKPEEEKKEKMASDSPESEKKEEDKEEKEKPEEEKKEEMSLDQNMDVAAIMSMLANETEAYAEVAKAEFAKPEGERNFAKAWSSLYAKMCDMAKENKALKDFKCEMEAKQFAFEVDSTMKEVEQAVEMPKEKFDALLEESKKFSLENIDSWKNMVKAEAFTFSKKEKVDDGIVRFANPWGTTKDTKKKSSLWE
jgi:hypothetical protein